MPPQQTTMIRRLAVAVIVLALILPAPMLTTEAKAVASSTVTYIDPRLMSAIESNQGSEMIPIALQFPDGTKSAEMYHVLGAMDLSGFVIRYIFHAIPYVSAYASKTCIVDLSKSKLISSVILDTKRVALDLPETQEYTLANGDLGYEHFTEILNTQDLWSQGYYGNDTTIAVLDSGVDGTHPDLQDRLIGFKDYIGTGTDMDPSNGVDAYDDNGHGTACAWNAVGTGESSGGILTGAAPGANLLGIKVLDANGAGDDTEIAEAMEWAADQGTDILSLSLGGEWFDDPFFVEPSLAMTRDLISRGVVVVIAAGNSGPAPFTMNSPAVVDEAISVGSSSGSAGIVAFSSRGPVHRTVTEPLGYYAKPDLVAPGYFVVSGRASGVSPFEYPAYNISQFGSAYTSWSGTSASAPQIAGLAALLMDKYPAITPLQVKVALMEGATDLNADPMEQGWGLANVSRADEILTATSGDITIMTPRRYPTLPGTSNVLIVGDDRPGQNVTILSTQPVGSAQIIISGNASQFVYATPGTISVGVGYTHFEIGLEIPEDLPLNAAGRYLGNLTLAGSSIAASIDLDLTITAYGGRMLVDMAHHDNDVDDPSAYRYFSGYLREQGVIMDTFGNGVAYDTARIGSEDLAATEIFTIMDTETDYSDFEINALHEFVEEGGILIMLSEFYDNVANVASFGINSYNRILEPFGIQCEPFGIGEGPNDQTGLFYGVDYGGAVENHPLMNGVSNLYVLSGSTLHVDPAVAGAEGLFWYDAEKTHAIVATAEYGNGRVIVISDGSTLYDDILYDAIRGNADNLRMLRNIASSIIPTTPRIYDIDIESAGIGEIANFTAYVFDDSLVEVTMTVKAQDGAVVSGTVVESLGYKYTASFILESGGFYEVSIVARDSDGNLRSFRKTFMIRLDAVDDIFVVTVTWGLLAVTGSALLYVGLNRAGIHRRGKRRSRDSFEEHYPPAIE
ncbi:MAG: S8 family serine peptidase [Promethearchaeota archaeon]